MANKLYRQFNELKEEFQQQLITTLNRANENYIDIHSNYTFIDKLRHSLETQLTEATYQYNEIKSFKNDFELNFQPFLNELKL